MNNQITEDLRAKITATKEQAEALASLARVGYDKEGMKYFSDTGSWNARDQFLYIAQNADEAAGKLSSAMDALQELLWYFENKDQVKEWNRQEADRQTARPAERIEGSIV